MGTKGKVRSFAEIFGEEAVNEQKTGTDKTEISIEKLIPFEGHPFNCTRVKGFLDWWTVSKSWGLFFR
jgi:hypothetical protein